MGQQEYELKEKLNTEDEEQFSYSSAKTPLNEEVEYQLGQKKVRQLGLAFMILFIAYGSCTSLISGLYKQLNFTNLGLMSLFFTYFVFAFACFIAKGIIQKFSYSMIFMLSNLGYTACIAAGIWVFMCEGQEQTGTCSVSTIYFIVNLGASLCGLGAATLWVAQGGYVDEVASTCPSKRGILIGQFFSFLAASSIIGYILASFLLSMFGNMSYFLFNSALSIVSAYLLYKTPEPNSPNNPKINNFTEIQQKSLFDQIGEVLVLLKNKKAALAIPYYWLQGVATGCYASYIYIVVKQSLNEQQAQNTPQYVSYVVIFLGVSGVVCGIITGKLADKYNAYVLAIGATLICSTAIIVSLLGLVVKEYALCFVIAILWGTGDSVNASLSVILGSLEFPGQLQIYSLQKLTSSLGCSFSLVMGIVLEGLPPYLILLLVMAFQIVATICLSIQLAMKLDNPKL